MNKILIKHVGNMGDLVFILPPVLETLKKKYPNAHLTLITAWGYKKSTPYLSWKKGNKLSLPRVAFKTTWGERNQGGFGIHLMMTNPHIDQLIHYHSTKTSLTGAICHEDGKSFPTWSDSYYREQKKSGVYDAVHELDFGLDIEDNPIQKMYERIGMPEETYSKYQIYLTDNDHAVARAVMKTTPKPRIVLLETLTGSSTRNWDAAKAKDLAGNIAKSYDHDPIWFGSKYTPEYEGKPLTLRQNIALLTQCDVAIGVLSGPLHFAAAVGLPTITLYCDQPLHRAAPAYFLNAYHQAHRTILGPSPHPFQFLKYNKQIPGLTPRELREQGFTSWQKPGRQSTKSCLAVITVDEIMTVLHDMLSNDH